MPACPASALHTVGSVIWQQLPFVLGVDSLMMYPGSQGTVQYCFATEAEAQARWQAVAQPASRSPLVATPEPG